MLLWPGVCIVHEAFRETELLKLKAQYPGAPVLAHPECPSHIIDHADHVGSTSSILDYALASTAKVLIVATEPHIIHQMEKAAPEQDFHRRARRRRQLQLQHVPLYGAEHAGEALRGAARPRTRIEMAEPLRLAAKKSLDRMLDMAGRTVGQGDVGRPKISGD
jgi:quinolinate synthase